MSTPISRIVAAVAIAALVVACNSQGRLTHLTPSEAAGSLPGDTVLTSPMSISGVAVASFHGARLPTEIDRMLIEHTVPHFVDGISAPSEFATRQFLVRTVGCDIGDEDTLSITPVAGVSSLTREQMLQDHGIVLARLQLAGPPTAPARCRTDPLGLPSGDAIYWIAAPDTTGKFVSRFIDYQSQLEIAVAHHPDWGFDQCPAMPPGVDRPTVGDDQVEATPYNRTRIERSVCDHPVPMVGSVTQVSGGPPPKTGSDADWTLAIACGKTFCYASPPPPSPPPGRER